MNLRRISIITATLIITWGAFLFAAYRIIGPGELGPPFRLPPMVVLLPHQDDELFMAGFLHREVKHGRKVYVAMVTDGEASKVREMLNGDIYCPLCHGYHNPAREGYRPLTRTAFGLARNREFLASMAVIGIPREQIFFLNQDAFDTQTTSTYQDGKLTAREALVAATWARERFGDGVYVTVAGGHPDHVALQRGLEAVSHIKRKIFFPLHQRKTDQLLMLLPDEERVVRSAWQAYALWSPDEGRYAIGRHSVPVLFDHVEKTGKEFYYEST